MPKDEPAQPGMWKTEALLRIVEEFLRDKDDVHDNANVILGLSDISLDPFYFRVKTLREFVWEQRIWAKPDEIDALDDSAVLTCEEAERAGRWLHGTAESVEKALFKQGLDPSRYDLQDAEYSLNEAGYYICEGCNCWMTDIDLTDHDGDVTDRCGSCRGSESTE